MSNGCIIILSGPSGVGKDTVLNLWQSINPLIHKIITCTTRPIREGEIKGMDYLFIDHSDFEEKIKTDYFIEHVKIYDYYYGTPKKSILNALKNGKWVVLKIDVQGALKLMKIFPEAITLFLMPPTLNELEQRIIKRATDSSEDIQKRLIKAQDEINFSQYYQHVVTNQEVNKTVTTLEKIIKRIISH